ncbi:hypothetical protein AAFO92_06025 [Roseovarius sp. CAU 1744]|uniref:hypothetical protein n=1 Tax=Roseovarius sp. CAU 1744 TaxID=3140368 RepID=UPI00325A7CE0
MGEIDLEETAWICGWRDACWVIQNSKLFWVHDGGGGAVIGAIEGWWAVVWIIGGFAFLLIGATASAPIRQRDEARAECKDRREKLSPPEPKYESWIDMETAAPHFYDKATLPAFDKTGEMAQALKNVGETPDGSVWPCVEHFFLNGISEGLIRARGHKEQSSALRNIPSTISKSVYDITDGVITDDEDMDWSITEIYRPSIDEYLRWLKK